MLDRLFRPRRRRSFDFQRVQRDLTVRGFRTGWEREKIGRHLPSGWQGGEGPKIQSRAIARGERAEIKEAFHSGGQRGMVVDAVVNGVARNQWRDNHRGNTRTVLVESEAVAIGPAKLRYVRRRT